MRLTGSIYSSLAFLLAAAAVVSAPARGAAGPASTLKHPYRQDRVLVAFKPQAPQAARVQAMSRLGLTHDPRFKSAYAARFTLNPTARAQGAGIEGVLAALRQDPSVRVAEPDYLVRTQRVPNDPRISELYGLDNGGQTGGTADADIDAPEAWDRTTGSSNVVVAVIDTGVDYRHPDLRDNILRDGSGSVVGYDFANEDSDPMDDNSHGTHCAGTIGARGDNGVGVAGVAWNVKIMPLKFLTGSGSGAISDAIRAVDFARENGAQVMSNSWGGGGYSQLMMESITRARDAGILFVAAATNGGDDSVGDDNDQAAVYPGGYNAHSNNVISVAATTHDDTLTYFSNYGARSVDLAAPGGDIVSTVPGGGYASYSGTSMATPHVAGAAALVLARSPGLTVAQLKNRLLQNVDRIPGLSGKLVTGGRLNVARAVGGGSSEEPPAAGDAFEVDNTAAKAKPIQAGQAQSRTLHVAGDQDWARFTLAAPADVTVETSGGAGDTEVWIYGPGSATRQAAYDDDGGTDRFSLARAEALAAGEYYIRVQDYGNDNPIAAYTLRLTTVGSVVGDSYERDDTPAQANAIQPGQAQARSLHTGRDADWAKFTLAAGGDVTVETAGAAGDTTLRLFGPNSDSREVAFNDEGGEGSFSRIVARGLAAGVYYVHVGEYDEDEAVSAYTLTLQVSAGGDAYEPDNTPAAAGSIRAGETQTRSLNPATDVDWITFRLDAAADVVIETAGPSGDTRLALYGPNSATPRVAEDDDGGPDRFSRIAAEGLAPGLYYVRVTEDGNGSAVPSYTLSLSSSVAAPAGVLESITLRRPRTRGGRSVGGWINFREPVAETIIVQVTASNPIVTTPAGGVRVPAGVRSFRFAFSTRRVARNTRVTLTAQYGGQAREATVVVKR